LAALTILHIALSFVPLALYLLASALIVRAVRADAAARPVGGVLAAQLGALVHAILLFGAIETPAGVVVAITDFASLLGWVIAATVAIAMPFMRVAALPAVLLPLAGLLATGTGLLSGFTESDVPKWDVTAHIALAALAAGWLAIAVVVVVLLTLQDTRLRSREPLGTLALMPPVETLESILFRALGGGFAVLTLALLTGFFFVHDIQAQHLTHKVVFAVVAWIVFGILLWGRVRAGWRGRRARWFTISGFAFLALAYFGAKFVLENLLGRHWG
jgi:ABC-type uncharacterized transport system permease subunit